MKPRIDNVLLSGRTAFPNLFKDTYWDAGYRGTLEEDPQFL